MRQTDTQTDHEFLMRQTDTQADQELLMRQTRKQEEKSGSWKIDEMVGKEAMKKNPVDNKQMSFQGDK